MSLNNKGAAFAIVAISLLLIAQHGHCQNRGFSYTQNVVQNNLNNRRAQLNTQVTKNLAAGKLQPGEAAALRDKLERLADLQLTYSEDSALNDRETNHLVSGYAKVTTDLNRFLSGRANLAPGYRWNSRANRFYRNSKARALAARIDHAVVDGRITSPEAEHMRFKYLSEGARYDSRLNELSWMLNRMLDTRSANVRTRIWD